VTTPRNSPLRHDPHVTCTCGKRGYTRRRTARYIRRRMATPDLHVYQCLTTDHWHVGHMKPGTTRHDYRTEET